MSKPNRKELLEWHEENYDMSEEWWQIKKLIESEEKEPSELKLKEFFGKYGDLIWRMDFMKGGVELARQICKEYDKLKK